MGLPFNAHTSDEVMPLRDDNKRGIQVTEDKQKANTIVTAYAIKRVVSYKSETNHGTYNAYVHYLNVICADIVQKRIRDATVTDIRSIYRKQSGLSASHLRKFCSTCKSTFNSAVAVGIIAINPCTTIKRPKGENGTHRALEEWEDKNCQLGINPYR